MSHQNWVHRLLACCLGVAAVSAAMLLSGCGGGGDNAEAGANKFEPADDKSTSVASNTHGGASTDGLAAPPTRSADQLAASGDTIQAKFAQLHQLFVQGQTLTPDRKQEFIQIQRSRVETARKILAGDISAEDRQGAVSHLADALSSLVGVGQAGAEDELRKLAASLIESPERRLAMFGREIECDLHLRHLEQGTLTDPAIVVTGVKSLLATPQVDGETFNSALQIAESLGTLGYRAEAIELLQTIAATFAAHADPQLATAAASLSENVKVYEADLARLTQFGGKYGVDAALRSLAQKQAGAEDAVVAAGRAMLAAEAKTEPVLQICNQVAQELHVRGFTQQSKQILTAAVEAFRGHADPKLAKMAAQTESQLQLVELGLETLLNKLAQKDPAAPAELVALIEKSVALNLDGSVMLQLGQAIKQELLSLGFTAEANKLMRTIATAHRASPDEQVAQASNQILSQLNAAELGVDAKLQKLAEKDPAAAGELVALVKQLIDSRADANVTMGLANTISERLGQYDRPVERAQLLSLVGQTYRGHSDEYVAHVAAEFLTQVKIIESGLDDNLKKLIVGEPGAAQQVLASMQAVLRTEKPGESLFRSMFQTAEYLEIANEFAVEQQILGLMEAAFAAHSEQQLADAAKRIIADSRLRMAMVGRPVGFAVQTPQGEAIDWSKYRGKTVLVNFWVTGSGDALQELNNLKRAYDAYQGRGFDVISVNLNEQRAELDKYLALNTVKWTMAVASPMKDAPALDAPVKLMEQWGISMLPFNVLVDREGVVVALHARGSDLDKKLEQLYGPPASSPVGAFIPAAPAPGAVPSPGDGAGAEAVSNDDLSTGPVYFTALLAEETEEAGEEEKPAAEVNPYRAPPGISDGELLQYLLDMADKPRVIQERPGFAEAVLEASDRLLAMDTKPNYKRLAVLSKLRTLHRLASFGDKQADEQLVAFVEALKDNTDTKVAVELKFLKLEREAIDCEKLPVEQIPDLLARLKEFIAAEKSLTDVHLRMASNTIRAVNRLENDDEREKHFAEFGKLFAASKDQQLSIYGQKLAKPVAEAESDLVGKELELTGLTALGAEFDWKTYRGKVVIVDFWATWCGPCIKALPSVKELHARLQEKGFDVVGISIDKDQEALAKFLEENDLPWETLAGEATQDLARKYGVRAIPTMMLVDRDGKVVAVSHQIAALAAKAEELLAKPK